MVSFDAFGYQAEALEVGIRYESIGSSAFTAFYADTRSFSNHLTRCITGVTDQKLKYEAIPCTYYLAEYMLSQPMASREHNPINP